MPMSLKYEWFGLVTLKKGLLSFHCRSNMNTTSSAFILRVGLKFLFECHFAFLRKWKM